MVKCKVRSHLAYNALHRHGPSYERPAIPRTHKKAVFISLKQKASLSCPLLLPSTGAHDSPFANVPLKLHIFALHLHLHGAFMHTLEPVSTVTDQCRYKNVQFCTFETHTRDLATRGAPGTSTHPHQYLRTMETAQILEEANSHCNDTKFWQCPVHIREFPLIIWDCARL